jgi:RNA polymerase sigma-70 factor (ECF subfamily)
MALRSVRIEEDSSFSDEVRFERLYDRYHANVVAYCRRRVAADRVEDLVAETFLVAWRSIDQVPIGDAGLPWLYRVAYRAVGHQWRGVSRRNRLTLKLAVVPDPPTTTPEDALLHNEEIRRVLEAAALLNDRDSEILRLLSWEHLSRAEIAEVLDLAPNAVSQRIHRARTNLTKEFNLLERRKPDRTPAAQKGGTP